MNSKQVAFIFPGQGSQSVGMGYQLAEKYPAARHVFNKVDELMDFSLTKLSWRGPESDLNDTINTQPALLSVSIAVLSVLNEVRPEIKPRFVAGHSMGELSALVASKALKFEEALHLTRRRGELMKLAGSNSQGNMAAVLGLDIDTIENICIEASSGEDIVQVANDNCPGQVVISGYTEAIERAIRIAKIAGARRIRRLKISIAAHSPLMSSVQNDFNKTVNRAPIEDPKTPMIGNVSAIPLIKSDQVRGDLQAQLTSRVRWTESIRFMIDKGVTIFLELGNKSVLTGLLKRIDENVVGISISSPNDLTKLEEIL